MNQTIKRPKTLKPPTRSLPPIKVEPQLFDRIVAQATAEGRTLSDLVRCTLRQAIKAQH